MDINILLIIIALILFILISLKRLDISLALIIFFLPAYLVRFQISFIPLTLLEVMILLTTVIWLIKVITKKEKIYLGGFFMLASFFILVSLVAVLVSPDTRAALGIFKAYFLEAILFFIVLINVIKSRQGLKLILFSLGASALFISLITFWQYLGLFPGLEPYISESPARATSLFEFPTAVGKYLGPIASLFLAFLLIKPFKEEKNKVFNKIFLWGVVLFSVMGIVLSVTRGAVLGVLAAFVFISFFSRYRRKIWLGLLILFIIFISLPQGRGELASVFSGQDTSTDVHLIMWQGTWRMLKDNLITGAGLAGFPEVYNVYRDAAHTELFPYPDNFFLAIWSELGLAGLFIFGWLFYKYIKKAVKLLKSKISNFDYQVTVGFLAVLIYIIFHGLVDTPYFKNDLSVMFWAFVGLLVIIYRLNLNTGQKKENSV